MRLRLGTVGETVNFETTFLLSYVGEPEGLIVELAGAARRRAPLGRPAVSKSPPATGASVSVTGPGVGPRGVDPMPRQPPSHGVD
jgi:hypothetical protein